MKPSSFRFGGLVLVALLSAVGTTAFSAEPAATIFNRKSGLLAGWSNITWGGLTVASSQAAAKDAGGVALLVTPTAAASPYAGLQIEAGSSAGIVLTEALRQAGEVQVYLRNGNDPAGKPAADHQVQLMLSFQPEGGKVLNGQYEPLMLDPAPADGKATEGWQLVKLSIPQQLKGRVPATTPVKLRGVFVQYLDQPTAAYFIGECVVVNPATK